MFTVELSSAGCLPDSGPEEFDELDDAIQFVAEAWADAWTEEHGEEPPTRLVVEVLRGLNAGATLKYPGENSLYAWRIEEK